MVVVNIQTEDKGISDVCSSYWAVSNDGQFLQTVSEISRRHRLNSASLLKIVSAYSTAYSEHQACVSCGSLYQFRSRSDFNNFIPIPNWTCRSCVETAQAAREQQFREQLRGERDRRATKQWRVSDLSFREIASLLSIIRHSAAEDLSHIAPHADNRIAPLTPDAQFDVELLTSLYRSGLLSIHPESDQTAFEFSDEARYSYYVSRVAWDFVLPEDAGHPRELVGQIELLLSSAEFRETRREEIRELGKELSLLECLSYLDYVLAEHHLAFVPGDKTRIVLGQVLDTYSVAQAYNLIWRAGRDAAAFYMRAAVNRRHAANTVVGSIQRQLDRALANNWNITAFHRNFSRPQSVLSQVVFNFCLRTDDGGFTQPLWKLIPDAAPALSTFDS